MVPRLTYERLHVAMLHALPELRKQYDVLISDWYSVSIPDDDEPPGQHVIFGDVFTLALLQWLATPGTEDILRRAFKLMEALSTDSDRYIREVADVTICERLCGEVPALVARARQFMGPATLDMFHRRAVYMGAEPPYDDDPPEVKTLARKRPDTDQDSVT